MFGLLATLALAAMAAVHVQGLPSDCDRNATVVAGDTCDKISAKYNVSTYQLAAVNAHVINADCSNLFPGEVICLGIKGQDCCTTHVVQAWESCAQIAKEYNIPKTTLLQNNPNVNADCTNTYPGEVLCVASTVFVNSTKTTAA